MGQNNRMLAAQTGPVQTGGFTPVRPAAVPGAPRTGGGFQSGPAPAAGGGAGGWTLQNTTQTHPGLNEVQDDYRRRLAEQRAREGTVDPNLQKQVDRLDQRMGADPTKRAMNFAATTIGDAAAGRQAQANEAAVARGSGGPASAGVGEAAQRQIARASAEIAMDEERRKDALTLGGQGIMAAPGQYGLQQQGMTNQALAGLGAAAGANANFGLNQQQYGLQQWQAQQQVAQQQAQMEEDRKARELAAYQTAVQTMPAMPAAGGGPSGGGKFAARR